MTLHSTSSLQGSLASAETTKGRRKPLAVRVEYGPWETAPSGYETRMGALVGECGHTLRWLAAVTKGDPEPRYLTSKVGRRMTCQHNDCRIPS